MQKEDSFQQAGHTYLAVGMELPWLNPENCIHHARIIIFFFNSILCIDRQAKMQL